ncbi:MAG: hypothetical protein GJ676_10435 [Rhodobacteraceae bacterium]|nr:hypothetical protein [Paracoccaceae bacterium]
MRRFAVQFLCFFVAIFAVSLLLDNLGFDPSVLVRIVVTAVVAGLVGFAFEKAWPRAGQQDPQDRS